MEVSAALWPPTRRRHEWEPRHHQRETPPHRVSPAAPSEPQVGCLPHPVQPAHTSGIPGPAQDASCVPPAASNQPSWQGSQACPSLSSSLQVRFGHRHPNIPSPDRHRIEHFHLASPHRLKTSLAPYCRVGIPPPRLPLSKPRDNHGGAH